jgi:hypothetical protein
MDMKKFFCRPLTTTFSTTPWSTSSFKNEKLQFAQWPPLPTSKQQLINLIQEPTTFTSMKTTYNYYKKTNHLWMWRKKMQTIYNYNFSHPMKKNIYKMWDFASGWAYQLCQHPNNSLLKECEAMTKLARKVKTTDKSNMCKPMANTRYNFERGWKNVCLHSTFTRCTTWANDACVTSSISFESR